MSACVSLEPFYRSLSGHAGEGVEIQPRYKGCRGGGTAAEVEVGG